MASDAVELEGLPGVLCKQLETELAHVKSVNRGLQRRCEELLARSKQQKHNQPAEGLRGDSAEQRNDVIRSLTTELQLMHAKCQHATQQAAAAEERNAALTHRCQAAEAELARITHSAQYTPHSPQSPGKRHQIEHFRSMWVLGGTTHPPNDNRTFSTEGGNLPTDLDGIRRSETNHIPEFEGHDKRGDHSEQFRDGVGIPSVDINHITKGLEAREARFLDPQSANIDTMFSTEQTKVLDACRARFVGDIPLCLGNVSAEETERYAVEGCGSIPNVAQQGEEKGEDSSVVENNFGGGYDPGFCSGDEVPTGVTSQSLSMAGSGDSTLETPRSLLLSDVKTQLLHKIVTLRAELGQGKAG